MVQMRFHRLVTKIMTIMTVGIIYNAEMMIQIRHEVNLEETGSRHAKDYLVAISPLSALDPKSQHTNGVQSFPSSHSTNTSRSPLLAADDLTPPKETTLSRAEVMRTLQQLHSGSLIKKNYFKYILQESQKMLHSIDNLYDMPHPAAGGRNSSLLQGEKEPRLTIVGDIHGQFHTMLYIFQENGFPNADNVYIFNGDFTDKGKGSLHVLISLLLFKLHCPSCIHLTRGNHETSAFLEAGKVREDILSHYDEEMYNIVVNVMNELPVAIVLGGKVLVIHGGISGPFLTLDQIRDIPKGVDANEDPLLRSLLWADPQDEEGLGVDRAYLYGPDISEMFLMRNKLDYIIRSHETVVDGYRSQHDGRVITIWSCPVRRGLNRGAYANVNSELKLDVKHFEAYPEMSKIEDWLSL